MLSNRPQLNAENEGLTTRNPKFFRNRLAAIFGIGGLAVFAGCSGESFVSQSQALGGAYSGTGGERFGSGGRYIGTGGNIDGTGGEMTGGIDSGGETGDSGSAGTGNETSTGGETGSGGSDENTGGAGTGAGPNTGGETGSGATGGSPEGGTGASGTGAGPHTGGVAGAGGNPESGAGGIGGETGSTGGTGGGPDIEDCAAYPRQQFLYEYDENTDVVVTSCDDSWSCTIEVREPVLGENYAGLLNEIDPNRTYFAQLRKINAQPSGVTISRVDIAHACDLEARGTCLHGEVGLVSDSLTLFDVYNDTNTEDISNVQPGEVDVSHPDSCNDGSYFVIHRANDPSTDPEGASGGGGMAGGAGTAGSAGAGN